MSSNITVYTIDHCPYCEKAKTLLQDRGIEYQHIYVDKNDPEQVANVRAKTKMRTFPQILNGDQVIGGYSELAELDSKDQLVSLR
jgi:glutaredoxin 3